MSVPSNPLDNTGSSSYRHVLVAFKYAEDAFKVRKFNPSEVDIGGSLPDVGENVVVVNDFGSQRFSITEAMWDFDFTPTVGVSTTTSVGKIVVIEKTVPYTFLDFLRTDVLAVFNPDPDPDEPVPDDPTKTPALPMSLGHATFVLKTFFITGVSEEEDEADVIQTNPFYFNIDSIESVPNAPSISPTSHILHVMAASNTTGLLRSFSSVFQMNITHRDGNIHDTIPKGTGSPGLKTRREENSANTTPRKTRRDLSKPMLTLKDMFEGLEADLNQQKFVHAAQLQEWRREIRSDNQPDKIVVSPQSSKDPTPKQLPMDFVIDLDSKYEDYKVDNRNMPFEQPEVGQEQIGIRVLPVRPGAHIPELIEKIMLLSKKIGEDSVDPAGRKTFKTTITAKRLKTDRYVINIKIRQYEIPRNSNSAEGELNTGQNLQTIAAALHFFVNDPEERDTDVLEFKSHINYATGDNMVEQQTTDNIGAGIVYADREQATAERRADLPFFQTLYSGIRSMVASYGIDGLESAQQAGNVFNLMERQTYTQRTDYEMVIRGNPNLLSDLNRNPDDVIDDKHGDGGFYYIFPEVNPMYLKLTIFERSFDIGDDTESEIPERFYFDDYYHITRVVNMFGIINGGKGFYQKLILKRSDTLI